MRMPSPISVRSLMKRFIMVSMCACGAALSMPAMAQQAPAASASDTPELQEIVVTGSQRKPRRPSRSSRRTPLRTRAS